MTDLPALRNKGSHPVQILTVGGELELSRRYFWSRIGGGLYPADALAGIESSAVSAGARELCVIMGLIQDFAQGAEDLRRLAGLRVSKERLRQITETEAEVARRVRAEGVLPVSWTADQARSDPGQPTRVYVGADGVMVRTVTQDEKDKRRRQQAIRRQQRGRAGLGNVKSLAPARPGSDQTFKEMKIGLFYDQSGSRVHAFATEGNHEAFGRLLRQHADAIGLERADESLSLTDGGPWIRNQILKHLKHLNAMLLDFYHLSEHIWSAAHCCLGDGPEAQAWAKEQLHALKHVGPRSVIAAIDDLSKRFRASAKRKNLRRLRKYLLERWEMIDYRRALARGWDIGSGPTEAMCKNLTLRLKRPGMRWDRDHAAGVMNLIALRESRQWDSYWQTRRSA